MSNVMIQNDKYLIDTISVDYYNCSYRELKNIYFQILSLRQALNEKNRQYLIIDDNMKHFEVYSDYQQVPSLESTDEWSTLELHFVEI